MRIAHVITRLILGGAQENTVLNCEDLIHNHGDEVLLVTGPPLGPEGSLIDRARGTGKGDRSNLPERPEGCLAQIGPVPFSDRAGGVPLEIIDSLRRPIHPWRDWTSYRRLKDVLRRFRPDVVHTHSAKGGMLGRAAAWSLGVPAVVHTVHGAPFHPWQGRGARWFFQACERWAARRCHAMISVADAMTELMVAANIASLEKFTTIYSGMEVEPFLHSAEHRDRVRRELGYSPDDIVIGKIARLFKLKGHDDVVRAAKIVIDVEPKTKFLFVGDGILREQLEKQIAAEGLSAHFKFTGLVPPERIPELISAMDIVVHASLREGLARVLPQALISGRPVVSYDIDGAREVVLDGRTGFLIPPRDIDKLAAALVALAAESEMRERFGAEGRRRFTDQFRHERMTQQIRKLYQDILDKGQGGE